MSESLYFEEYGEPGNPVVIFLHGLLGSSRNWRSIAKTLSPNYHLYALDLPEHGASPHSTRTDLKIMSVQIGKWIEQNLSESYVLCGHSLGGKVAMAHACSNPDHLQGLVVVDIAPRDYPPEHHLPTLDALLGLELSGLESRKQADDSLIEKIPNWAFRQFLLTNLQQRAGVWQWRVNLGVLRASMMELSQNPLVRRDSYSGPTLFLRGGKSGYLRSEHFTLVTGFFPGAKIVTLPDAGHDLHVEDKDGFLRNLNSFLENLIGF
ncbi:MAG: alpha/beta fold hydrolase [Opitutales bacterium]|nr:alpha/beta fold hydrolase [Opitutales bacterium]